MCIEISVCIEAVDACTDAAYERELAGERELGLDGDQRAVVAAGNVRQAGASVGRRRGEINNGDDALLAEPKERLYRQCNARGEHTLQGETSIVHLPLVAV